MELIYLILIGLMVISILLLAEGLKFVKNKRRLSIGIFLIVLGIILILFVLNNYIILIKESI